MASVSTPYGFKPVGVLTGPYNGQIRRYRIASGYATSIFTGDLVEPVGATGTIALENGTTAATPLGVFMGCEFTNPITGQRLQSPYWPASTVASDAVAFVFDSPYAVLQVQAAGAITQASCFENLAIDTYVAGSTAFGVSRQRLGTTPATTNTLPFRIIGFVEGPDSVVGDAFTDLLVIYNHGMHPYSTATGV